MIDLVVAAECFLSIDYGLDVVAVDFAPNLVVIHSMERIHYVILETVIENVAAIESKNVDLENGRKKRKTININKYILKNIGFSEWTEHEKLKIFFECQFKASKISNNKTKVFKKFDK